MRRKFSEKEKKKIADFKEKNPWAGYSQVAAKFNITPNQAKQFILKFNKQYLKRQKEKMEYDELLKKIAIWKSNHPEMTIANLMEKFNCNKGTIDYAMQKYNEAAQLGKVTKRGRIVQARMISDTIDQVETLKNQLNYCLAEMENNVQMAASSRLDMLFKAIRIRVYIQDLEIESHIKRLDADVISQIIRRFLPKATADDIIKIYTEEHNKWKMKKGATK